jgi:hypothetical protein
MDICNQDPNCDLTWEKESTKVTPCCDKKTCVCDEDK